MEPLIPKPISIVAQGMLSLRANALLGVAGFDFCGDWLFFLVMDARSVEGKQHGNHGASICNNRMLRMVERTQSRPFLERSHRWVGDRFGRRRRNPIRRTP